MPGIHALGELLRQMEPELDPQEFVYCALAPGTATPAGVYPVCRFQEEEGETLILRRTEAEVAGLPFAFVCRKITLRVPSSLDAVGFLARVSSELAAHGISANCVSAYHHDHLFVPSSLAQQAMQALRDLQGRSPAPSESPSAVVIQEMTIADYEPVYALLKAVPGVSLRSADSREAVQRYLARNPGLSFVALSQGRIAACVMCGHDGRRGYLQHLAVEPGLRRQGIATRLVERCLEALERLGVEKVHIEVLAQNSPAHQYWTRRGWQKRDDIVRYSFVNSKDPNA